MGIVKVMSLLIEAKTVLGFSFGVRVQTEMVHAFANSSLNSYGLKVKLHILYFHGLMYTLNNICICRCPAIGGINQIEFHYQLYPG